MKSVVLVFIFTLFTLQLSAQQITVSGTVTDDVGLPLPGVNIIEKGTTNGSQTDFDGNYSITTSVGSTLVFSYVGFESQEFKINSGKSILNLQMNAGAQLEEVVVTAYGAAGSARNIRIRGARSLQGKVSGVSVIRKERKKYKPVQKYQYRQRIVWENSRKYL
ncbi:carboxypeptidase-like regulatory domain-containing protein [Altibacter lentus]|uniref:carboxypeptidase-like regulatory domain-containing protein n=1 Tax=Altibacter lentus TaxID=1223410 RepID=UPI00054E524C|nr:carboxypeptidase-like regulatory domain-containing protein [Altibacter lentus]